MWNVKKTNTEHFARDMYFNNTRYVYLKIHVKDLYCIKILKREKISQLVFDPAQAST